MFVLMTTNDFFNNSIWQQTASLRAHSIFHKEKQFRINSKSKEYSISLCLFSLVKNIRNKSRRNLKINYRPCMYVCGSCALMLVQLFISKILVIHMCLCMYIRVYVYMSS